jgi:hypothetical protein
MTQELTQQELEQLEKVALDPKTSPEALTKIYQRQASKGLQIEMFSNPNMPAEILLMTGNYKWSNVPKETVKQRLLALEKNPILQVWEVTDPHPIKSLWDEEAQEFFASYRYTPHSLLLALLELDSTNILNKLFSNKGFNAIPYLNSPKRIDSALSYSEVKSAYLKHLYEKVNLSPEKIQILAWNPNTPANILFEIMEKHEPDSITHRLAALNLKVNKQITH